MSAGEQPPVSSTHERAWLEQENGEIEEDVVASRALDREVAEEGRDGAGDDDEVEEQGKESFPASDPPSSWGAAQRERPGESDAEVGDGGGVHGRVMGRTEVSHPHERAAPDDPVPRTLPREPG